VNTESLPVMPVAQIPAGDGTPSWLVEHLWSQHAVGIVGGAPKCCKTWLALDLAVSVATGTPALGRFAVPSPGPVLLYGAEDAPLSLRDRIEGIVVARRLRLADLDVGLITVPSLRLDTERDRDRLRATVECHKPRLLLLDPLVRLHRIDENCAADISALLGELRALQRRYAVAIVLVHHLRKNAPPHGQDGLSLRGSGDLHAWGDSNLYLKRRDRHILLTVEHRSAPAPASCCLELAYEPAPHLRIIDAIVQQGPVPDIAKKILEALAGSGQPIGRDALRERLHVRNAILGDVLARLRAQGLIERCASGFRLRSPASSAIPVPLSIQEQERNALVPPDLRLALDGK
jgi:hypothetical protein